MKTQNSSPADFGSCMANVVAQREGQKTQTDGYLAEQDLPLFPTICPSFGGIAIQGKCQGDDSEGSRGLDWYAGDIPTQDHKDINYSYLR